jgi:hypothetical protein
MSSCKCGSTIASENVAEQPHKSITLEEWRVGNYVLLFVGI